MFYFSHNSNYFFKNFLLVFFIGCIQFQLQAQNGHFKVRSDEFVQIGYDQYKVLSFGSGTAVPTNGHFALEYWESAGALNFFKPWPTWNAQNYILALGDNGNVSIGGPIESNFKLRVHGSTLVQYYGFVASDKRFKRNIKNLNVGLSTIMQLRPVSYQYNFPDNKYKGIKEGAETEMKQKTIAADKENKNEVEASTSMGLIAQEVKEILPEIVGTDDNGYHSVQYTALVPVLIKALQEQQTQIEELKRRVEKLENQ